MSKRLLLFRHAKSAWPDGLEDRERPLASRGQKAAPVIGRYIAAHALTPQLVLVSPAKRTLESWDLVKAVLGMDVPHAIRRELYEATAGEILAVIRSAPSNIASLMIIGHNPGLHDLVRELDRNGDPVARARVAEKFPTAGLAVLIFDIDRWEDVRPEGGYLDAFTTPKSLE
jgi:phosphohistidine phosphatase